MSDFREYLNEQLKDENFKKEWEACEYMVEKLHDVKEKRDEVEVH